MILLTVGTQLAFDRLVAAMDDLAPSLPLPVFAQTGRGTYVPRNIQHQASLSPSEFDDLISRSSLLVSHAGIGTVLTAKRLRKPIVIFPRRAGYKEHRNDHQLATAQQLMGRDGIVVAMEEGALAGAIAEGLSVQPASTTSISPPLESLRQAIRDFIITAEK